MENKERVAEVSRGREDVEGKGGKGTVRRRIKKKVWGIRQNRNVRLKRMKEKNGKVEISGGKKKKVKNKVYETGKLENSTKV